MDSMYENAILRAKMIPNVHKEDNGVNGIFPVVPGFFPRLQLTSNDLKKYKKINADALRNIFECIGSDDDDDHNNEMFNWMRVKNKDGIDLQKAHYIEQVGNSEGCACLLLRGTSYAVGSIQETLDVLCSNTTEEYRKQMENLYGHSFLDAVCLGALPRQKGETSSSIKWAAFQPQDTGHHAMDYIYLNQVGILDTETAGGSINKRRMSLNSTGTSSTGKSNMSSLQLMNIEKNRVGFCIMQSIERKEVPLLNTMYKIQRAGYHRSGFLVQSSHTRANMVQITAIFQMDTKNAIASGISMDAAESLVKTRLIRVLENLPMILERKRLSKMQFVEPWQWVPNHYRKECVICNKSFTLRKKHHCRQCGEVVCAKCAPHRDIDLQSIGITKLRICTGCVLRARNASSVREQKKINANLPYIGNNEVVSNPGLPKTRLSNFSNKSSSSSETMSSQSGVPTPSDTSMQEGQSFNDNTSYRSFKPIHLTTNEYENVANSFLGTSTRKRNAISRVPETKHTQKITSNLNSLEPEMSLPPKEDDNGKDSNDKMMELESRLHFIQKKLDNNDAIVSMQVTLSSNSESNRNSNSVRESLSDADELYSVEDAKPFTYSSSESCDGSHNLSFSDRLDATMGSRRNSSLWNQHRGSVVARPSSKTDPPVEIRAYDNQMEEQEKLAKAAIAHKVERAIDTEPGMELNNNGEVRGRSGTVEKQVSYWEEKNINSRNESFDAVKEVRKHTYRAMVNELHEIMGLPGIDRRRYSVRDTVRLINAHGRHSDVSSQADSFATAIEEECTDPTLDQELSTLNDKTSSVDPTSLSLDEEAKGGGENNLNYEACLSEETISDHESDNNESIPQRASDHDSIGTPRSSLYQEDLYARSSIGTPRSTWNEDDFYNRNSIANSRSMLGDSCEQIIFGSSRNTPEEEKIHENIGSCLNQRKSSIENHFNHLIQVANVAKDPNVNQNENVSLASVKSAPENKNMAYSKPSTFPVDPHANIYDHSIKVATQHEVEAEHIHDTASQDSNSTDSLVATSDEALSDDDYTDQMVRRSLIQDTFEKDIRNAIECIKDVASYSLFHRGRRTLSKILKSLQHDGESSPYRIIQRTDPEFINTLQKCGSSMNDVLKMVGYLSLPHRYLLQTHRPYRIKTVRKLLHHYKG